MTLASTGLLHVVPVSDLERSARWYERFFDLEFAYELCEQAGCRAGGGVFSRSGSFSIALCGREAIAGPPLLRGDLFSVSVPSAEVLRQLQERCADLGLEPGDLEDRSDGQVLDIPDPDGTIIRCYHCTWDHSRFTGVAFDGDGAGRLYDSPRLDIG